MIRGYHCNGCQHDFEHDNNPRCECSSLNTTTSYKTGKGVTTCSKCGKVKDTEVKCPKCSGTEFAMESPNVSLRHTYEDPSHYRYWRKGKSAVDISEVYADEKVNPY